MTGPALQRCAACGHVQYPARECCEACLADDLADQPAAGARGTLIARTLLHHSNELRFGALLPLGIGLVRLDAGPIVVCFVPEALAGGARVVLGAAAADPALLSAAAVE